MSLSRLLILAAATFAVAGAAQAFTIEGGPGSNGPSTNWKDLDLPKARALDPDSRFSTESGRTEFKTGSGSFYFGNQQSFEQKYNSNNLFDPYAREGR
jgi:hypothetical protein